MYTASHIVCDCPTGSGLQGNVEPPRTSHHRSFWTLQRRSMLPRSTQPVDKQPSREPKPHNQDHKHSHRPRYALGVNNACVKSLPIGNYARSKCAHECTGSVQTVGNTHTNPYAGGQTVTATVQWSPAASYASGVVTVAMESAPAGPWTVVARQVKNACLQK
jgi:hypothetical protein